jgi:hypothetical protein
MVLSPGERRDAGPLGTPCRPGHGSEAVSLLGAFPNDHRPPIDRALDDDRTGKSIQLDGVRELASILPFSSVVAGELRIGAQGEVARMIHALPYMHGHSGWRVGGRRVVGDHWHADLRGCARFQPTVAEPSVATSSMKQPDGGNRGEASRVRFPPD